MSAQPAADYARFGFADPENAKRYSAGGPANFVPGFWMMHRLAIQLLSEDTGEDARVLVLGAGGGLELKAFADARPGWRFTGVDPSRVMLEQAKAVLGADARRVDWIEGYIPDAPPGPFDAATCLLTLHFVADDGSKLAALRAIRQRLKPGAPFALVDICVDQAGADLKLRMDRYAAFGLASGVPPEFVARARNDVSTGLSCVSPAREENLLREAGFSDIDLFFAGLSWRGWIAAA